MANLISKIKAPNNTEYLLKDSTLAADTGISIADIDSNNQRKIKNTGVTGVKGNSESAYRTGQVNLTSANIGAKATQNAVNDVAADGTSVTFISQVTQNTQGVISPVKKTVATMGAASADAAGSAGLVPAPAAGKQGQYLRGDGTWATPSNTTYTFDGTYNSSTNKAATVSTVTNAINALDVEESTGTTLQTITAISETNGKIAATYSDIASASTSGKGVVQLSSATNSTSTSLAATASAVKAAYDLAASKTANTGTVTKVSTGAGLTGGDITTTGTVKANLTSETKLTNAAADGTETSGRVYPVRLDKNGKLAVNVPWTNTNSSYLTAHQTIKQDGVTGATVNRFGTCSTAAGTAAKAVSITTGTFNLEAGARVSVYFSNANTANSPTLNVNSKGAKNIFHKGAQITSGNNKALLAGVVDFIYDGTQWHLIGNYIDTNDNTKVTSVGNHYTPTTATVMLPEAVEAPLEGEICYLNSVAVNTDAAGHVVSVYEDAGKLKSETAASGGETLSLVTTGEKATWNAKTTNTGTVTKVSTGAGLTGGDITSTGTLKAALTSETKLTNAAADGTETSGRVYPVRLDKNGKLAVNVPWTNVNSSYLTSSSNLNADKLSSGTVPVARLPDASTSAQGVVQLSDATNSTSTTLAATANAVKKAYDLANGKTANTGTVTSVKLIQGNNITINSSGTAITTSGERTISLSSVQHPLVAASSTAATQTSPYKPSLWAFNLGVAASSLATGMMVTVKIPVATTSYGSFISIDNGTTYKPIAVGTGKARLTTHYSVDDVVTLFYDASGVVTTYALAGASNTADISGGCWRVLNYYDSGNSNDTATMYIRHNHGTFAPTTALYSYELCLQSFADNAKLIPVNTTQKSTANSKTTITTAEFDPFADIIYYSRDATVNANTNIGVSYVWLAYSLIDLRYSFNTASTLTANKDIYIVAKMQDNGSAKLRNPGATGNNAAATATGANAGPITQTLPTSDDGYIYIKLGRAYDSYRCSVDYQHQIYWYKNGKVRLYPDTGCPITKYGPSAAFSSLPVTFENAAITADMVVLNYVLSNPTAQINNWTVTTAAGSLTISGQVRGSTTITLYLGRCEQEA